MYKLVFHPTLAARWQNFSPTQQIFMIGNELNRALNAHRDHDLINSRDALERAFELLDLAIASSRSNLQREMLRLREVLAGFYENPSEYSEKDFKNIIKVLLSFNSEAFNTLAEQYS